MIQVACLSKTAASAVFRALADEFDGDECDMRVGDVKKRARILVKMAEYIEEDPANAEGVLAALKVLDITRATYTFKTPAE